MLREWWGALADLFFPPKPFCPLCGGAGGPGGFCDACRSFLEKASLQPFCPVCGRFFAAEKSGFSGGPCRDCRLGARSFGAVRAAGPYEGALKEAVLKFKYGGERHLAAGLAGLMARAARGLPLENIDRVVPVPMAAGRLRQRGYNQAELLAREVAGLLGLAVDGRALVKVRETPAQAGLNREERLANLAGAFWAREGRVRGRGILLVDDVVTTGSTMTAAAGALAGAGAAGVWGLAAASARVF